MLKYMKIFIRCTVFLVLVITQAYAAGPSGSVGTQTLGAYISKELRPKNTPYNITLERLDDTRWLAVRTDDGFENIFEIEAESPLPPKEHATNLQPSLRRKTWSVNLLHNGDIAGFYEYSYSAGEHPLPIIDYLEVNPLWSGSGAADILFEDFIERVLKGDPNAPFKAHIARKSERTAKNTAGKKKIYTVGMNKKELGILSVVTYEKRAPRTFEEMPRKEARAYMQKVRAALPMEDRKLAADAYTTGIISSLFGRNKNKFILRERSRDAHFFVLEALDHKTEASLKIEKLRYYLAQAIDRAWGSNLLSFTETLDVRVDDIDSPRLKKWAKRKGLAQVTLVRAVTDYMTDTSRKNENAIEAQIPFYVMTRDYDHKFAARNSFWIPEQATNISFDHNAAFDTRLDTIELFLRGDKTGPTPQRHCLFAEIFEGEYYISENRLRALYDKWEDLGYRPWYPVYRLDVDKVIEYAQFMAKATTLSDRIIQKCVHKAGFAEDEAHEIVSYLKKWRDHLIPDLTTMIRWGQDKQFSFGAISFEGNFYEAA